MKSSNDELKKNLVGDISQFQDVDVARRFTKASAPKENDLLAPGFDGQIQDNQSQHHQQTKDINDFYAAQSVVAMSPTNRIRMYDEILNQNQQASAYNKSYQIKRTNFTKNGPASAN